MTAKWWLLLLSVVIAGSSVACPGPGVTRATGIGQGGAPARDSLAFTVQPSNAAPGNVITPAIQVTVRDTAGQTDSTFTQSITIAIGANPVGATLTGTRSVVPVFGVASFGNLRIDRAGTGYTLTATAPSAVSTTSSSFNIAPPGP